MTVRQVGAAVRIALLGGLLPGVFRDRLDVTGLPARTADSARDSAVAAHLIARWTGSAGLAASANSAYVHGMDVVPLVCGVTALVTALQAAAFLPNRPRSEGSASPDMAAAQADVRQ